MIAAFPLIVARGVASNLLCVSVPSVVNMISP